MYLAAGAERVDQLSQLILQAFKISYKPQLVLLRSEAFYSEKIMLTWEKCQNHYLPVAIRGICVTGSQCTKQYRPQSFKSHWMEFHKSGFCIGRSGTSQGFLL